MNPVGEWGRPGSFRFRVGIPVSGLKTEASFVFFSSAKVLRESRESSAEEFCYFDGRSGLPTRCLMQQKVFFICKINIFCIYFSLNNFNYPNKKLAIPSN